MQKNKVGRPRKVKSEIDIILSMKPDGYDSNASAFKNGLIGKITPLSHTRERVDALEDTVFRMKLVLLSMSEAIEREDFDNLSKEVCRILNI